METAMENRNITFKFSERWQSYRKRRRMQRFAEILIEAREAKPELLRYLERLEMISENQARELKMLRWSLSCEQMADVDEELDRYDWLLKAGKLG
jgi:hypothetical protein